MTNANYSCQQQELYTAATLGWNSCRQHSAAFQAFSPLYSPAFIDAALAEVVAASSLPDEQARNGATEVLRIQLTQITDKCLANYQYLKRYISKAFTPEFQKAQLEIAGQAYYEKARHYNWDSVQGLLSSAANYLTNNDAALQANNNMPPAFPATFQTDRDEFLQLHYKFLDSEELGTQATEAKIDANNKVYATLISMFLDGQEIFKADTAVKKQFVFSDVLYLISGAGTAGVRGTVTSTNTGLPVANAALSVENHPYNTISAEDGKYRISPMASGTYSIKIEALGYETKTITGHNVLVGTVSALDIELTPTA